MPTATIDDRDWSALSTGARIRQLEVEGYLLLPDLLDPDHVARLKAITATFDTKAVDYSENQRGRPGIQFDGGEITALIGHPPTLAFLRELFGDEVIFMHYGYARSEPGHPGISLHADGQPYGSQIFGFEGSCPVLVRVLYYLDDLPSDRAPFRLIPRSHLSFHAEANPYVRYISHPQEITLCARAGTVVMIPALLFHGTHPNRAAEPRELIQFGYRPAWAGPVREMEDWDPEWVAQAPEAARPYLQSRNTTGIAWQQAHKPQGMQRDAPGINPSRWGD